MQKPQLCTCTPNSPQLRSNPGAPRGSCGRPPRGTQLAEPLLNRPAWRRGHFNGRDITFPAVEGHSPLLPHIRRSERSLYSSFWLPLY